VFSGLRSPVSGFRSAVSGLLFLFAYCLLPTSLNALRPALNSSFIIQNLPAGRQVYNYQNRRGVFVSSIKQMTYKEFLVVYPAKKAQKLTKPVRNRLKTAIFWLLFGVNLDKRRKVLMDNKVKEKIKEIAGKNNFTDLPEDLLCYSYDGTALLHHLPEAVVFPENEEQVFNLIKLANDAHFNIVPRGSGTGLSGGSIPVDNSVVVVMTRWDKILEIDTRNLTATVQPGVITGRLQTEVEKYGLFYPPDPGSLNVRTIGGNCFGIYFYVVKTGEKELLRKPVAFSFSPCL
jgi:hypothetical protein